MRPSTQATTQIPGSGKLIEGIINLRGTIIPIYSLRKKFGFPEQEYTKRARIVVVESINGTVGIIMYGVSEVQTIPGDVIEKPSSVMSSEVDVNYIYGIAKKEESLVIILNLEQVINPGIAEAV